MAMTTTELKIEALLRVHTCTCGIFYGVPTSLIDPFCPACAQRRINYECQERDELIEQVAQLERRISSLKGALTKAKGKGQE